MTRQARGPVNRATRESAKRVLRQYGLLTAGLRRGPDFVIVGAKRGGTTSLYNYLLEHPSIQPLFPGRQHIKGVHYYDSEYQRGRRWYRSHFPLAAGGRQLVRPAVTPVMTGEASPYYLFHPLAAERLAADYPDIRIIITLRDPVERAYSHFKERTHHRGETLSFEAGLAAEEERLRGEAERIIREPGYRSIAHEDHSYVAQGRYLDMLPRWFALFPREQFHIMVSEEFYANPERHVNEIWSFLGLAPARLKSRVRHNYLPAADIRPQTRQCLQELLAGHNRGLEELLGRTLPWPSGMRVPRPAGPPARASGGPGGSGPGSPAGAPAPAAPPPASTWPSVSAIIATRDRPELLARALRGVLGQAYPGDLECIVVFDRSSPAGIPAEVPPGRIRVMTNSRTPGLAGARNTGIAASGGALIAFCDDDDEWAAGKLRCQVEHMGRIPAEFVGSGIRIHHGDRVVARVPPPRVELQQLVRERVTALHPSTLVMRRAALMEMGLVDEGIPGSYGEDYDWLLRAARRMPIAAVPEPLVDVYWHEQSFFAERWETIADALAYLLGKHPELRADPQGRARVQGQIAFAHAAQAHRATACRASVRALRGNPRERRAYLALGVASGVVPAASVLRLANRFGRGI
jgi:Glycosyl transferase family 2/Sulfotransferase domain